MNSTGPLCSLQREDSVSSGRPVGLAASTSAVMNRLDDWDAANVVAGDAQVERKAS